MGTLQQLSLGGESCMFRLFRLFVNLESVFFVFNFKIFVCFCVLSQFVNLFDDDCRLY